MMGSAMNATHRHSFYKPRSFKRMFEQMWDEQTKFIFDGAVVLHGQDPVRSNTAGMPIAHWVSDEKVKSWLANWDQWAAEEPEWFTSPKLDFQREIMQRAPLSTLPRSVLIMILTEAQ